MRLIQYLTELSMKAGTQLNVIEDNNNHYFVDIILESGVYFEFSGNYEKGWNPYNSKISVWSLDFTDSDGNMKVARKSPKVALQLFAAIEQVVKDLIIKKNPEAIKFLASDSDPGRLKLYEHLAKRLEKNGYIKERDHKAWFLFTKNAYEKYTKAKEEYYKK